MSDDTAVSDILEVCAASLFTLILIKTCTTERCVVPATGLCSTGDTSPLTRPTLVRAPGFMCQRVQLRQRQLFKV